MKTDSGFFDFAAEVGLTKHVGGMEATEELIRLCRIREGSYVLDVGCGVGVTACYLAGKHRCKVVGVDILEKMVERSRERAGREKVSGLAEFRVANAQDLPFEDGVFDAVITESVTAFPEDKPKAVREYRRVVKPGGYVGLNESTWLKYPPPQEILAWASQDLGTAVKPLTENEWRGLMSEAGITDIVGKTYSVSVKEESRGIVKRYGCLGFLGVLGRMFSLYLRSADYREFVKEVRKGGITPPNLNEFFGYGIYVGRK